ncbi:DUF456 domain-containing protein [Alkalihalobacillus sp. AL-G]|uniref:DUF456 domain-containing protein n=1 Tax=Alkalihalobacillus sp. AL-G TaxID=2926399 RepID=UPI00272DBE1F|nr:DUF456 family protein [Alkalihalobacillus sp. AL-G]WLD92085.1 DUF456 family protein [Alkalihalobacillus sp. AL-G]
MELTTWLVVGLLFLLSFVGLIYPILPASFFLIGGFLVYGWLEGFEQLTIMFWIIQGILILLLYVTDYASNYFGVQKRGGSKYAIWGSTIGLIIGPIVIPIIGILIGPFAGAIIGEAIHQKGNLKQAVQVGIGSLLGFIGGTAIKLIIQVGMIIYFFIQVLG